MTKYIYNIVGWDPVNTSGGNVMAMIYIKPDLKLLSLFQRAPLNNILTKVQGTKTELYDDKVVFGTIDKSSDILGCRPNLFNCDGLYCITLDHLWGGYPLQNGTIEFLDEIVKSIKPEYQTLFPVQPIDANQQVASFSPSYSSEKTNLHTNYMMIFFYICICLLVILIIKELMN
jgi:hypothetical protein